MLASWSYRAWRSPTRLLLSQDATSTSPATTTVERSAKGPTGKAIQIGIYLNVQADCTSGTLPDIRLVAPPASGTVSIKRGKVSATNYKQCLALEVPGFIAFYRSKPDFVGTDMAIVEVKYPQGRTELASPSMSAPVPAGRKFSPAVVVMAGLIWLFESDNP